VNEGRKQRIQESEGGESDADRIHRERPYEVETNDTSRTSRDLDCFHELRQVVAEEHHPQPPVCETGCGAKSVGIAMKTFLFGLATACCIAAPGMAQLPCASTVTGDLHVEHFQSRIYQRQQTVRVWLPPGYRDAANAQRKYPVLYMLDGQTLFDNCTAFVNERELQADETATRLIAEGRIESVIIVGIDSDARRAYEYLPYKDLLTDPKGPEPIGRTLPDFLANEVLPYVAANYRVTSDARQTAIGGASIGGIAALYALLNRPDLFGMGLLESPTLPDGNGQLLRDTGALARGPDRAYIGVGTTELAVPGGDQFAAQLRLTLEAANAGFAKMCEVLASNLRAALLNHPDVLLVVEPNANHTSASWARRFPRAMMFLYGKPACAARCGDSQ
jgi:predicted alpha/beta superfamily hydrolase